MTDNRVLTADEIDEALGVHSQTSTSTKIMMHGVARAIEAAVVAKVNTAPQASAEVSATPRPTDDELWDQTLRERDEYHDMADQLAAQIAAITGEEIGEHSSANDPWRNAMLAADDFIAAQIRKMCTAPAADESAKCVGCEGKPSGDNVPCVVCGADSAKGAEPDIQEKLKDPNVVHVNMLRGTIAPITFDQLAHILGDEATAKWIADRQQRGGDASEWIALKAIAEYPTPGDGSMSAANMREIARKALMAAKKGESNE